MVNKNFAKKYFAQVAYATCGGQMSMVKLFFAIELMCRAGLFSGGGGWLLVEGRLSTRMTRRLWLPYQ